MKINSKQFGETHNGETVIQYTLTNDLGASVSILNLGGVIREIIVPDASGTLGNVVLGFDTVSAYEACPDFIGAAIGRSAGRISNAILTIGDTDYPLAKNNGNNNLHGGPHALDKVIWDVSEYYDSSKASITLNYLSPDMEEGFPGELDCNITYTFDNENALTIKYVCTTDKKTFVNMTNHSYFNLSGDVSTTIADHILLIHADNFLTLNKELIPCSIVPVNGTPFDFTLAKTIGADIDADNEQLAFGGGYDHCFELNQPSDKPLIIAKDPKSGRVMEVTTKEKCVVLYTGNFLRKEYRASGNVPVQPRSAFCLETQYYPDSINAPFVPTVYLEPGQLYRTTTTFRFK